MTDLRTRGTSLTLDTLPGRLALQHNEKTNIEYMESCDYSKTQSVSGHSRFRTVAKGLATI